MLENSGNVSSADRLTRVVFLLVGAVVQACGAAISFHPDVDEPLTGLLVATMGCAMATAALFQILASKGPPAVVVLLDSGEATDLKPSYRPGRRSLAAVGLVVVLAAFAGHARAAIPLIRPAPVRPAGDYDSYPRRYLNNALVDSYYNGRLSRYTTYTGRILDVGRRDHGLSFTTAASLQRRHGIYGPATLDHETFAFEFELKARSEHAPVKVEAIRVIVDAYEPPPRYDEPVNRGSVTDVNPFYLYQAVLSAPSNDANNRVLARLVALDKTPSGEVCEELCLRWTEGEDVFLTDEKPTAFLVKIEAPEPGFYGFDIEVLLSSGMYRQRFGVASFLHVLFY